MERRIEQWERNVNRYILPIEIKMREKIELGKTKTND